MQKSRKPRVFLGFLFGLLAGLGGETLLFVQRQCGRIEEILRDDFRVVLFLKSDLDAGRQKVVEEQLRAFPEVESARFVSRQDAMAAMRRDDPELMEAVVLLTDNPLSPSFEVKLRPAAIARVADWVDQAQALDDWSDIRYKPAQVQAILQAQFYERMISVALDAIVCLAALMALWALWFSVRPGRSGLHAGAGGLRPWLESWAAAAAAGGGTLAGAGAASFLVLPMRLFGPWWAWPPAGRQGALFLACALAGWVLCGCAD